MEERENVSVPYLVHESVLARMERTIKRLWILCIVLIVLFVGSNAGWLYYESLWSDEVTTITQENADGYNNYIGNDGDINNGETNNNDSETIQKDTE